MDLIRIEGLRCLAKVGVSERERAKRQPVELDVILELDLRAAARADDVRKTADYWAVEHAVRADVESGTFKLLERLAEVAASAAFAAHRHVRAVRVRAVKHPAVMPKTGGVAIEIRRTRGH